MNIVKNISLKPYNTFGIDAKAKYFIEIFNEDELKEVLHYQDYQNLPRLILGGGSNILITQDFDGLVIKISIKGVKIISENDEDVLIEAGAGEVWHNFVLFCIEKNYGGIENLSLIPGLVGAAPIQNIGAYGQELKDVFVELRGISVETGETVLFSKNDCNFGYRDSIFKNELKDKFIITYVTLNLSKKPKLNLEYGTVKTELEKLGYNHIGIKEVSEVICSIRRSKLPDPAEIGNAGSFFKNPEIKSESFNKLKEKFPDIVGYKLDGDKVKVAAGWLIEKCGWKGKRVGNTGAHAKQSLVLVNYGNAKGDEILKLSKEIKKSVLGKFGIELQEEVNII
jgi:UDP-N-acetylmuramate dehydrogenase